MLLTNNNGDIQLIIDSVYFLDLFFYPLPLQNLYPILFQLKGCPEYLKSTADLACIILFLREYTMSLMLIAKIEKKKNNTNNKNLEGGSVKLIVFIFLPISSYTSSKVCRVFFLLYLIMTLVGFFTLILYSLLVYNIFFISFDRGMISH